MSVMSRKCPHCGKEIVQDDWIVVPLESWNRISERASILGMKDATLDKLGHRFQELEDECDKLKKAIQLVDRAIVNAGNPCWMGNESEWPFRKGEAR
jgi:hypothetical protein